MIIATCGLCHRDITTPCRPSHLHDHFDAEHKQEYFLSQFGEWGKVLITCKECGVTQSTVIPFRSINRIVAKPFAEHHQNKHNKEPDITLVIG